MHWLIVVAASLADDTIAEADITDAYTLVADDSVVTGALVHWRLAALVHWRLVPLVTGCAGDWLRWCTGDWLHWFTGDWLDC